MCSVELQRHNVIVRNYQIIMKFLFASEFFSLSSAHTHTRTPHTSNTDPKKKIIKKNSESIYNQKVSLQSHGKLDINLTTKSKQLRALVHNATKDFFFSLFCFLIYSFTASLLLLQYFIRMYDSFF